MGKKSSVLFKASDYFSPKFWPMWFILGLLRLASLLPFRAGQSLGRRLGRFLSLFAGSRRNIIDTNLARCFPEKNQVERDRIKLDCYQNFGVSLIEMAMCWWWPESKLKTTG